MEPGLIFLGVAFVLMVVVFRRSSQQRREYTTTQNQIAPGVTIMTTSGMYATILEVDDQRVTLQTGPGQTSQWDRRAIGRIIQAVEPEAGTVTESGSERGPERGSVEDDET